MTQLAYKTLHFDMSIKDRIGMVLFEIYKTNTVKCLPTLNGAFQFF